jgi:hypothetical protein
MTPHNERTLEGLAALFSELQPRVARPEAANTVFEVLVNRGADLVAGCEAAAITRGRNGKFETIAASSELPLKVDSIQYDLGYGPCIDAIRNDTVYHSPDLANEQRWPRFGERVTREAGVQSMVSYRMFLEGDDQIAGLNFYSTKPDAFSEHDRTVGLLLSTHGALAVAAVSRGETAAHMTAALKSNREIGVAMGVLMATHKLTRDQAFDLLRIASQHTHRKLADIAVDVADTGTLDLPKF